MALSHLAASSHLVSLPAPWFHKKKQVEKVSFSGDEWFGLKTTQPHQKETHDHIISLVIPGCRFQVLHYFLTQKIVLGEVGFLL